MRSMRDREWLEEARRCTLVADDVPFLWWMAAGCSSAGRERLERKAVNI